MAFLDERGKEKLSAAIEAVEARSRAELVVVVREAAGNYRDTELIVGGALAWAALAFMLYSSFSFALHWFLVYPPLLVLVAVGVFMAAPGLRGLFVGEARKQAAAERAAAACFFDKGIRHTRERTGILVYVACFEQQVVILADAGITSQVPEDEWSRALAPLRAVFHDEGDASLLAERITALEAPLASWCEVREDDIDELSNAIDDGSEGENEDENEDELEDEEVGR
ncbi:hypothetical protein G6O69_11920 [Pseudenhygromyxa sp. WMMC2535]|uniref:hypothetical protein n=1 Tax=Pseudenhygromyxa sp. WMMC2535 TaxID=2712867 RepID=UPI001553CFDF|nr:hypothetical protein [Pseudenhygromyxa sp. WMMC2535]NVB38539.1 hypothetical protein [Pseudenhygromyxa sp. WMMC2535]